MDLAMSPAMISFLFIIFSGFVVMGLSRLLDHVWSRALNCSWPYFLISAPGVIVHECSHIIGCLLTGAKIKKVVLVSKEGGMVSYAPPVIPIFGNVIISTAPLFILPLVLAALTWMFGTYAGCTFISELPAFDSVASVSSILVAIGQTLSVNLYAKFNAWFLLYLYLVLSLVLSFSPSTQDLKNAIIGILIIAVTVFCLLFARIPEVTGFILKICGLFSTGLAIGFAFELVALVVTLPVLLFYRKTP